MSEEVTIENVQEALYAYDNDTEQRVFEWVNVKYVHTQEGGKVVIDGDEYFLHAAAFRGLCEVLEVPTPYARRIPEELLQYTINYFLEAKGRDGLVYSALTSRGGIRAFLNPTYPYVPASQVFDKIVDVVGKDSALKYVDIAENKISLVILPPEYIEPIDGTNVYGGLRLIYSDSWSVFPRFDAFLWRELCSNGMIEPINSRKFRVSGGTTEEILRQVEEFAQISLEKLPDMIKAFKALLGEVVKNWETTLNRICIEHKVPNKVRERIRFWAVQPEFLITISNEKIENMHDLVNLITYAGTHDYELTEDNREALLEIAAYLVMSHEDRCGSCGSAIH